MTLSREAGCGEGPLQGKNSNRMHKRMTDAYDARRRRGETAISIRKSKREEGLQKRRNISSSRSTSPTSSGSAEQKEKGFDFGSVLPSSKQCSANNIPSLALDLSSPNATEAHSACRAIRKLLSHPGPEPPVEALIEAGGVVGLVSCLGRTDSNIQFEAAWALTNVASTNRTAAVVEAGAVSPLTALLVHENADVREQAAWCMGNIAGDSAALRDICLAGGGVLSRLLLNITQSANDAMRRNCVWALSNLCRGKPQPKLDDIAPAIPMLRDLLSSSDREVLTDACWALSYMTDGAGEVTQRIIDEQCLPRLVAMLFHENPLVMTPALRTVGNIVSGNDKQTQVTLDAGILPPLTRLLYHPKKIIRKETCWMLSNIAAGTVAQIGLVCGTTGLLAGVTASLAEGEWDIQKEAAWIISNLVAGGSTAHIERLMETDGLLQAFIMMLNKSDINVISMVMDAIETLLKADRSYKLLLEEAGGLDAIEYLQVHSNENVYKKAVNILETYFCDEEDFGFLEPIVETTKAGHQTYKFQSSNIGLQETFSFG